MCIKWHFRGERPKGAVSGSAKRWIVGLAEAVISLASARSARGAANRCTVLCFPTGEPRGRGLRRSLGFRLSARRARRAANPIQVSKYRKFANVQNPNRKSRDQGVDKLNSDVTKPARFTGVSKVKKGCKIRDLAIFGELQKSDLYNDVKTTGNQEPRNVRNIRCKKRPNTPSPLVNAQTTQIVVFIFSAQIVYIFALKFDRNTLWAESAQKS